MKVLVLFGSKSDSYIYEPLNEGLNKDSEVEFHVLSAHRNPEELEQVLKTSNFDVVVAGAGLAAHLPGVVASKVKVPVIGIPVESQFGGLDALFSVQQMPYGVPVLSSGPNDWKSCVRFVNQWRDWGKQKRNINLVVKKETTDYEYVAKELERTKSLIEEKNLSHSISDLPIDQDFNIFLIEEIERIHSNMFGIHVPILDSRCRSNYVRSLDIYNWAKKGGLWVGVNNTRNAILMYEKLIK